MKDEHGNEITYWGGRGPDKILAQKLDDARFQACLNTIEVLTEAIMKHVSAGRATEMLREKLGVPEIRQWVTQQAGLLTLMNYTFDLQELPALRAARDGMSDGTGEAEKEDGMNIHKTPAVDALAEIDERYPEPLDSEAARNWQTDRYLTMLEMARTMERRLNWAANELLACDYGDNDTDIIGWLLYGWRDRDSDTTKRKRIYGGSINDAIDQELAKLKGKK